MVPNLLFSSFFLYCATLTQSRPWGRDARGRRRGQDCRLGCGRLGYDPFTQGPYALGVQYGHYLGGQRQHRNGPGKRAAKKKNKKVTSKPTNPNTITIPILPKSHPYQGYHLDFDPFGQGYHLDYDPFGQDYHLDYDSFDQNYHLDSDPFDQDYHLDYDPFDQDYHLDYEAAPSTKTIAILPESQNKKATSKSANPNTITIPILPKSHPGQGYHLDFDPFAQDYHLDFDPFTQGPYALGVQYDYYLGGQHQRRQPFHVPYDYNFGSPPFFGGYP